MATQVISANTAASTQSSAIASTKVRVSTNSGAVYYAVGSNPTANSSNCEIVPANSVRYINMLGSITNKIAFLAVSANTSVSVTSIGTVYQSALNQNSTSAPNGT